MDRCDECGFEYDLDGARDAGAAIVGGASELAHILTGDGDLRTRPDPDDLVAARVRLPCT